MLDEKRNINDINDQQTAEQQAFSEEIRRRLAEPGSGKPTLEEFKVMVYKDREKRRKKRNALVACIVAAFIVGYLTYDDLVPEVGADKNPKETIKTEDGVIIEDGGWGSSDEQDDVLIIDKWSQVQSLKIIEEKILIPNYLPKCFEFKKAELYALETGGVTCKYLFTGQKDDNLEIEVTVLNTEKNYFSIDNIERELHSQKGKIYILSNKMATMEINDGNLISIWHNLDDEEIIKIIEGLN